MTKGGIPSYSELEAARAVAERLAQEAATDRKAAAADRESAAYDRGQAEHRLRTAEATLRAVQEREQWLEQHDEARVRAIVVEAEQKLAEAKAVMADFNSTRHGAARALIEIDKREAAAAARREA